MKNLAVREGIVWLALVVLTLVGFFNYERGGPGAAYVVLGAGLVKFFLIFYDFMEMKYAHRIWLLAMGVFLVTLFGAITIPLSRAVVNG